MNPARRIQEHRMPCRELLQIDHNAHQTLWVFQVHLSKLLLRETYTEANRSDQNSYACRLTRTGLEGQLACCSYVSSKPAMCRAWTGSSSSEATPLLCKLKQALAMHLIACNCALTYFLSSPTHKDYFHQATS